MGVSKTSISYGAPYMKALADKKLSHEKIENKMVQLIEETGYSPLFSGKIFIFHVFQIPKIK